MHTITLAKSDGISSTEYDIPYLCSNAIYLVSNVVPVIGNAHSERANEYFQSNKRLLSADGHYSHAIKFDPHIWSQSLTMSLHSCASKIIQ